MYSHIHTKNRTDKFKFNKTMLLDIFSSRIDNGDNHLCGHEVILCIGHGASIGIYMYIN